MDNSNDEKILFNAVWERVNASSETGVQPAEPSDDCSLLAALISHEKGCINFYRTAAYRFKGSCTPLFNSLENVSRIRLSRLQTFYFLLQGNNCTAAAVRIQLPDCTLAALREAYWQESETASRLISSAASINKGRFSCYAAQFARQAAENAEHIIQFIDKIMK